MLKLVSRLLFACFALVIMFDPAQAAKRLTITVSAEPRNIQVFKEFVAQSGPIEDIRSLDCEQDSRPLASLIILLQALAEGDLPAQINFLSVPNSARMRMAVSNGHAVASGEDLFSNAFTDDVYITSELIPIGEFVKGIYVLQNNTHALNMKTLDEIRTLKAVSSFAWKLDWETLKAMDLAELRSVPRMPLMTTLVHQKKVDFAMLEFPACDDLTLRFDNETLVPIPGMKVSIHDSRHFMISKTHPDGKRVYEAFERGLKILKKSGRLKKLYTDVGIYNRKVADWKIINP